MENLSGAEIVRFLSLRRDLLAVLLEIHETIEEGRQYITQEDGMAFPEEAMQDAGTMPELNVDDKEGDGEAFETEEKGSQSLMNGIGSVTSGDADDEHSTDGRDGSKIINDDQGVVDGGAIESENEDAHPQCNLGVDSQTRVGDGEAGPGQERGRVISRSSLGRSAVRPGEGSGVISQEEGMSCREEARQDAETMPKFNVEDKERDGETVESEKKGSASSMDGIVSVTCGDAEDESSKSGHVGNDDEGVDGGAKESENEDGPQLMDEGLIAIVENEQLPDIAVEDDQNQFPTLQTARGIKPESLRSKRSGKWHKRKE